MFYPVSKFLLIDIYIIQFIGIVLCTYGKYKVNDGSFTVKLGKPCPCKFKLSTRCWKFQFKGFSFSLELQMKLQSFQ